MFWYLTAGDFSPKLEEMDDAYTARSVLSQKKKKKKKKKKKTKIRNQVTLLFPHKKTLTEQSKI